MKNIFSNRLLFIIILLIINNNLFSQGADCSTADPFCTGTTYNFPLQTDNGTAEVGPDYGCLCTQPNPVWYYLNIATAGDININISSTCGDIDYAAWGPFATLTCNPADLSAVGNPGCGGNYDIPYGNMIDCAYSTASVEDLYIPNAQVGEFYMLMINNYANCTGNVVFSQTSGTGATDCSIVIPCNIIAITTSVSNCPTGGSYTVTGTVTFTDQPTTGTLTICDDISGLCDTYTAPFTSPWTYTISGIPADGLVHTLTATFSDEPLCLHTQTYTATQPDITATYTTTNPSCNGGSDGVATISGITGGNPGFTYTWSPNVSTTNNATGLTAGTYNVTITDANGCTATHTFVLTEPTAVTSTISSTPDDCGSCNGTATVSASGGTPGYTYSWSGGGGTAATATGLCAGTYTVTITDANGCTATNSVTVALTGTVTASFTYNGNQCLTGNNYIFTNTGTTGGGTTFSWDFGDGVGTSTLENPSYTYTAAGTYTVTLTVTQGSCTDTYTQTITVYDHPTLTITPTDATCFGLCDGSAIANPVGGSATYTYSWSNSQNTQTATGLCAGTYTVTVSTVPYGCTVTGTTTINEPAQMVLTVTRTDANCNGACDGTAQVSVTGGSGSYTYQWNNLATTANISGLCAGTYTVTVTDANSTASCTQTASVVIAEPAAIVLSTSSVDATCGASNGSATVSVTSGGTPGYTYLWDAAAANQNTATASNLAAGSYTVTVTDVNNCTETATVNVNDAGSPTASITSFNDNTCNGSCDGDATVSLGGTLNPPYDYSWSTGTSTLNTTSTTETEAGLCAGTVSVTITDNNGCVATASTTISEPTVVSAVISSTTDAHCGNADGSATVLASGGSGSYTYQWDAAASNQTTATASNLAAGSYTVTVTDVPNGCTATVTAIIIDIAGGTASITSSTNVSCAGLCDGQATATGVGGTPGYTYLWDAAAANQNTATATGLCAGTYTVTVTDANNCTATTNVTITEPTSLTASITASTDATCFGVCDGTATVAGANGTPAYTYMWPSTNTGATETGLCAGTFTVTVTDANLCTTTASVTINEPTQLTGSTTVVDAHCNQPDGSATATGINGTPGYTYLWDAAAANQNTATATNLSPGTYSVTITDANGCTFVTNATVGNLPGGVASISSFTDVNCNGNCDGTATVSMSGGTSPYTYSWNTAPAQNSITATNLCPGTYTVTVTDVNNCTSTASATITEPAILTVAFNTVDINCFGYCDGEITANITGGTINYSYQWDDPLLSTSQTITGLCDGTYCVTVTDANNCTVIGCQTMTEPPLITLSAVITDASCNQSDGAIDLTITNATVSTISWTGGYSTEDLTGIPSGTYTVTVTDIRGCTATGTYVVPDLTGPTATISSTDIDCNGNCNGTATVTGTGGVVPYTYAWSNGINTISITNLCAGTYTASVTDANGCVATASVTISEPPLLQITNIPTTQPLCNNDCNGTAEVIVVGGVTPYTYLWTGGNPAGGLNPTDSLTTGLCNGVFNIQVTDNNGCIVTNNTIINEPPFITLSITSTDATCSGISDGSATVSASGGTPIPGYLYQWDANTGNQTTQTASNLGPGNYCVTVTDANMCTETICVTVNTPNPMTFQNVSTTDLNCFGVPTGSISTSVSGGTPGYTYTWSANNDTSFSASTQNINGLYQDTYFLTVSDINGCSIDTMLIINQPPLLTLTLIPDSEVCYQACDGSIQAIVSGGTPNITFAWSDLQNTATASNLCPGTYSVTVTDAMGCSLTATENIYGPPQLQLNIDSVVDATCGNSNGAAYISQVGGTTGYTVMWSNNSPLFANENIPAGNYTVTLTDANGCSTDTVVTVNNLGGPQITGVATTDVSCAGDANGTATVSYNPSSPPAPPYTITWSSSTNTLPTETGLSGGTYYVTVQDNNGCQTSASYIINEPQPLISAIVSSTDVNCYGECTGSADLLVQGGTSPYTVNWSNSQTGMSATNLCAGPVTAMITDNNGCQTNSSTTINEQPDFIINATINDALCNGSCNGTIDLNVSGATPIYTYNWLPPASGNNSNTASLCGNNTYTVIISDMYGCDTTLSYFVGEPQAISIYTSSTPTTCGNNNGAAQIDSITGGVGGCWDYLWNPTNNQTSGISNVSSGNYSLQVTDCNGCVEQVQVNISEIPEPTIVTIETTDITCPGGNDGQAIASMYGNAYPHTYQWNPSTSSDSVATNLPAGQVYVTVTDNNGCSLTAVGNISEPDPIVVYADGPASPICIGQSATITVNANGGTPPYTYVWSDSTLTTYAPLVSPTQTTTYQVYITDANGCISSPTAYVTVDVYPPLDVVVSPDASICEGKAHTITAVGSGGNGGPYTYTWNYDTGNPIEVSPTVTTTYIVTVYDGCGTPYATDTMTLTVIQAPQLTLLPVSQEGCEPLTAHFESSASVNTGTVSYFWNFGDPGSGSYNTSSDSVATHFYENAGIYDVTLTLTSNPGNCQTTETFYELITVHEIPVAEFYPLPEVTDVFNGLIEFFDQSTPVMNWYWTFGDGTTATEQNPEHVYSAAGIYPVQLAVTTGAGCVDTVVHNIEVKEQHTFYAPSAFSPGSGLQNNYFYPKGIGIDPEHYELWIYDRWGEVIYNTTIYPEGTHQKAEVEGGWNGRYHNTGKYVKVGTYTWYVKCIDVNGMEHEYVGAVTVIR